MTLEELQVVIKANSQQYEKALSKVQTQTKEATSKISDTIGKIGKAVAAALSVAAIVQFGKSCIDLGSDLMEVQNVVDVTFGSMAGNVNEFAKTAIEQFGLSETAAKKYTSTMGAMLKSMGFGTRDALAMSEALTGLSADMASFYNLDSETAFEKIRSGIAGETEPLKQLGINMSAANLEAFALSKGITKAYNSMSQGEQTLLRYNYLMQVTADAQGDFARTSDGWANQTRVLQMRFEALKATLGQAFINLLTPIIKVLNIVIAKLTTVAELFASFVAKITGQDQSATVASGYDNMADSAIAAGDAATEFGDASEKAAKKAKASIMSFDEIHALTDNSSDKQKDDEGAFAGLMPTGLTESLQKATESSLALSPRLQGLIDRLKELAGLFKDGFKNGLGNVSLEPLKAALDNIRKRLKEIFTDPDVVSSARRMIDRMAYAMGQIAGAFVSVGITIATNLIGGFSKFLDNNSERIKKWLIDMFDVTGDIYEIVGNIAAAFANIFSVFGGENGQEVTAHILGIFWNIFAGVTEIAGRIGRDFLQLVFQPIIDNQEGIKTAIDGILGVIASILGTIEELVGYVSDKVVGGYDAHVKPLIDSITAGLSSLVGQLLDVWTTYFQPILDGLAEKIQILYDKHIKDAIDQIGKVLGKLIDLLKPLWEQILYPMLSWLITVALPKLAPIVEMVLEYVITGVSMVIDVIKGLFEILEGLIDFISGVFSGDWDRAWTGIQETFGGVWTVIESIAEGSASLIRNTIGGKMSDIKKDVEEKWPAIKNTIGIALSAIKSNAENKWSEIKSDISNKLSNIKGDVQGKWSEIKNTISNKISGIKKDSGDGFSNIKSTIVEKLSGIITEVGNKWETIKNTFRGAIDYLKGLFDFSWKLPDIKLPHFNVAWNDIGMGVSLPSIGIDWYAKGGFPDMGSLFFAGESGPELVGTMGGKTAVANNDQIVEGISNGVFEAVYDAMRRIMSEQNNGGGDIVLMVDSEELARASNRGNARLDRRFNPTISFT